MSKVAFFRAICISSSTSEVTSLISEVTSPKVRIYTCLGQIDSVKISFGFLLG